jgi:hypothetical protein
MSVIVEGIDVEVRTSRLTARFRGPKLVQMLDAQGHKLVARKASGGPPGMELWFASDDTVGLGVGEDSRVTAVSVGDRVAHVMVEDVEGDACLRIAHDEQGRLLLEPSAQTIRTGLGRVQWNLSGIAGGHRLVAPFYQGCRQELEHPLVAGMRAPWPHVWEAALAILQRQQGGFSICCHDHRHRAKSISVGHEADSRTLGLATDAPGPLDDNRAVGSLVWILDVHEGDWKSAASGYRDWLREECGAGKLAGMRPDWVEDIRLTLQWTPCRVAVLKAVARIIDPSEVLIHVPAWRSDAYDVNYPQYLPSDEGKAFIARAVEMGFHVAPHFNYCAVDPNHAMFDRVRDFVVRDISTRKLLGWRWEKGPLPFPQAAGRMEDFRDTKTMAYVHAGLSTWRRELVRGISRSLLRLETDAAFVDQTLCTFNCDNSRTEDLMTWEGMLELTRELAELDGPPAVCGEGLNELSMRHQSFAQAHLFKSHHRNCEHFGDVDPVPLGHFLYGDLCRTMGYTNLSGEEEATALRLRTHEKLGALPTLVVRDPEQIRHPNAAVQKVLARARR